MKNIIKKIGEFFKGVGEGNKGFEIIYKCCTDNGLKVKNIKPANLKEGLRGFYDIKDNILYFDLKLLQLTKTEAGCRELYDIIYSVIAFVV